ncbi:MAG: protein tyrosine kinase modulator [Clostridiales bacterium]|nr:protein tyrosine kinase modulator [Clostridiales bacterium]
MENNHNATDEVEIDLLELFFVLKSKLLIILLSTLVMGAAFGLFSKFVITPVYTSTSKLYILTKSTSITSLADIQMGTSLTQDYMELIKSRPVVETVIKNLKLDTTYEDMLGKIEISNPSNTRILKLTIEDNDPRLAKEIADEFADVSIERISKIMDTDKPNIVEEGHIAEDPASPNTKKNAVIGALLGFVLCAGVIVVLHLLDDTIRSSDDMEKYLGLNTLAAIPMGKEEYDGRKHKKGFFGRFQKTPYEKMQAKEKRAKAKRKGNGGKAQ